MKITMTNSCKQYFNTHYQPHCHPTTKSLWLCSGVYCGPPHQSRRIWLAAKAANQKANNNYNHTFTYALFTQMGYTHRKWTQQNQLDIIYIIYISYASYISYIYIINHMYINQHLFHSYHRRDMHTGVLLQVDCSLHPCYENTKSNRVYVL